MTGSRESSGGENGEADESEPAADRARRERSFRGISRRLAVRYLSNLGGDLVDDDGDVRVAGDGWEATLTEGTASVGPSLTLTEVTVTFEGDPEALDDLIPAFAQKAMRAGG